MKTETLLLIGGAALAALFLFAPKQDEGGAGGSLPLPDLTALLSSGVGAAPGAPTGDAVYNPQFAISDKIMAAMLAFQQSGGGILPQWATPEKVGEVAWSGSKKEFVSTRDEPGSSYWNIPAQTPIGGSKWIISKKESSPPAASFGGAFTVWQGDRVVYTPGSSSSSTPSAPSTPSFSPPSNTSSYYSFR